MILGATHFKSMFFSGLELTFSETLDIEQSQVAGLAWSSHSWTFPGAPLGRSVAPVKTEHLDSGGCGLSPHRPIGPNEHVPVPQNEHDCSTVDGRMLALLSSPMAIAGYSRYIFSLGILRFERLHGGHCFDPNFHSKCTRVVLLKYVELV